MGQPMYNKFRTAPQKIDALEAMDDRRTDQRTIVIHDIISHISLSEEELKEGTFLIFWR